MRYNDANVTGWTEDGIMWGREERGDGKNNQNIIDCKIYAFFA